MQSDALQQWSQTRGPREGLMGPANISENEHFKINIKIFFKKLSINSIFFFIFLMRPARHFEFETPALQCLSISYCSRGNPIE